MRSALSITALLLAATAAPAQTPPPWQVAGRQGLLLLVIVPMDQARDQAAYEAQIKQLCPPERTCFVNFYTNSTGVEATVPLPDAIDQQATATFRRSMKQVAESFRWSCRMQQAVPSCF
jgi:hypothetical protein